jgi:hypothetical protein
MSSNCLALNKTKTKIFVVSRSPQTRNYIKIPSKPKDIKHTMNINLLGITATENLSWNQMIKDSEKSLISQLKTRNAALKQVVRYSDFEFSKKLANGLIMSKMIYGIQV